CAKRPRLAICQPGSFLVSNLDYYGAGSTKSITTNPVQPSGVSTGSQMNSPSSTCSPVTMSWVPTSSASIASSSVEADGRTRTPSSVVTTVLPTAYWPGAASGEALALASVSSATSAVASAAVPSPSVASGAPTPS